MKRGFKAFRDEVKGTQYKLRNIRDCKSCASFFEDTEGDEEYCHDSSVTSYDMVNEDNKTYCSFWRPMWVKEKK